MNMMLLLMHLAGCEGTEVNQITYKDETFSVDTCNLSFDSNYMSIRLQSYTADAYRYGNFTENGAILTINVKLENGGDELNSSIQARVLKPDSLELNLRKDGAYFLRFAEVPSSEVASLSLVSDGKHGLNGYLQIRQRITLGSIMVSGNSVSPSANPQVSETFDLDPMYFTFKCKGDPLRESYPRISHDLTEETSM